MRNKTMSFRNALLIASVISGILLSAIILFTLKPIPPYKYKLKFVEDPDVLTEIIKCDSSLNSALRKRADSLNTNYENVLKECIDICNKNRMDILRNNYYSTRSDAKTIGIDYNDYINKLCMDSLRMFFCK